MSSESRDIIRRFIDINTKGFVGALSMICEGKRCPFLSACPLEAAGSDLPVGLRCPVEQSIVYIWVNKHLVALGIEDTSAPEHSFDMDMLYELAGQELLRWRCSVHLSDDPKLVENQTVGYSQNSEPIFADVINPVLEIMDRCGKNVAKIREALLATRKAQSAAGHDPRDLSQKQAEVRKKASQMQKSRLAEREQIRDAEFEVKES